MLKGSAGRVLPTTIIGSLPRPSWYTENLGTRSFLDAMVDIAFRDQYVDALTVYIHQQELAGLDIVTDGDARFDHDVGGQRTASTTRTRDSDAREPEGSRFRAATSCTITSKLA